MLCAEKDYSIFNKKVLNSQKIVDEIKRSCKLYRNVSKKISSLLYEMTIKFVYLRLLTSRCFQSNLDFFWGMA